MPVAEASLTLSFPCQNQYVSCRNSETTVQCFVCNSTSVFRFDLLRDRNCAPNIDAKSFSLESLSLLTNFQNLSTVYNLTPLEDVMLVLSKITSCNIKGNKQY